MLIEEKITAIEIAEGPYGLSLTEVLLELAELQFDLGMEADAVASIEKSIFIARIHGGPNSPVQNPLIEGLIRHYFEKENWREVELWLSDYLELKTANLSVDDPEWVRIYGSMVQWAVFKSNKGILMFATDEDELNSNPNPNPNPVNRDAHYWLDKLADQIYLTGGDKQEVFKAYKMRRDLYFKGFAYHPDIILSSPVDYGLQRKLHNEGSSYFSDMLLKFSSEYETEPEEIAQVMLDAADWHLRHNKHAEARRLYKECYDYLKKHDFDDLKIDTIVNSGDPIAVSDFDKMNLKKIETDEAYWEVKFNISPSGKISSLKIKEAVPDMPNEKARDIKRSLYQARFRPRLEQGEPVKSPAYGYRIYSDSFVYNKSFRWPLN